MSLRTVFAMMFGVVGISTAASAQGGDPRATQAPASTLAGVYTDVQATRGEEAFRKSCLECHVPSDYQGDAFKAKFVGGTAFDMFEQIRTSMPQSDPGSLSRQQYADILAYVFRLNALPAGKNELGSDADVLKGVKVEAKDPGALRVNRTTSTGLRHGSPHIR